MQHGNFTLKKSITIFCTELLVHYYAALRTLCTSKGNEPFETWLLRLLNPRIDFHFHEIMADAGRVVLLEIDRASRHPVAFESIEYIRVGSTTRKLKDYPEKERTLRRVFDRVNFEDGIAAERLRGEDVLLKLDYPAYFDLLNAPLPDGRAAILDALR